MILLDVTVTMASVISIVLSFIALIVVITTLIIRLQRNHKMDMQLKADVEEFRRLRDRVDKKADKEYVDIFIERLNHLERRHEIANTQLRDETLKHVQDINSKINQLHEMIFAIIKKE